VPKTVDKPVDKIILIVSEAIGMKININPQEINNRNVLYRASK